MSHARLAPSKSSRVLACAASANREAALPDDDNSPAADEGSNVHWIGELALKDQCWPPNLFKTGMPMVQASAPYPDIEITDDNIENAKQYYEYVTRRVTELNGNLLIEAKVDPQIYTGRDDSPGSCDAGIVSAEMLEVVDYKNGGILVEADASQLRLYGLGLMAMHADPLSGLAPFKTVRLTVFQPRRPGMDAIERSEDFTQEQLIEWATATWTPAAKATDNPNAKATPSDEGCKYCKAQKHGACPEYTAAVQGAAAQLFDPVGPVVAGNISAEEVLDIHPGQVILAQPSDLQPVQFDPMLSEFTVDSMTPDDLSRFLEIWPLMKARGKDIEERAIKLLTERTPIPNFKLVRGPGRRQWALKGNEEEQIKKFRNMKLKLTQIFNQDLKSPAQMLAQELPTSKKEAIKKHIVNSEGALTLAPINDKRVDACPAITFNPVETAEVAAEAAVPDFLSL